MGRLATGIAGLDRMLDGGLPEGTSVVLQGPPGQEKLLLALTFLAEGLKAGASGLLVLSSQSAESILSELRKLDVDLDTVAKESRLRIVDWYSWSEESVQDVEEHGIILRSSADLSNAGAALSRAIASLSGDKPKRAVVEILSPAMNVFELSQVYAFAQSSKRKFDRFGFTSLVILEKEMHDAAALSTLHQPFDGVIEMERVRTGDRIVRKIGVLHLKGTTPEPTFLPLVMTDRGFRVVDPKAPLALHPGGEGSGPVTPVPIHSVKRHPLLTPLAAGSDSPASRVLRIQLIMDIARERLNQDPTDADALFALAAAQATQGDIRASLESLRRLADVDERYPGLWVLKAKLHARVGEEDEWRRARMKADGYSEPSVEPAAGLVPCPVCQKPIAKEASLCPSCGSRTDMELDIIDELEKLTQELTLASEAPPDEETAVPEALAELEAALEPTAEKTAEKPAGTRAPSASVKEAVKRPEQGRGPKGLTNGHVLRKLAPRGSGRSTGARGRTNGLTNGLRGRTNGLTNGLGRTNGLTNGLGRTNGLTNGLRGRTNGLTNGLRGRTNGLTNGLGRTNGLTNGLGRTNGLTNGLGRTNGLARGRNTKRFLGIRLHSQWQRVAIPAVVIVLLILPLFFLFGEAPPQYPIAIDGQFSDWASVPMEAMTSGAVLNPNVDVVRFGAVDNLGPFAFYVQVAGTALAGGGPAPGTMDTVRIFVDIDGSAGTGYRIDGIGADRMIDVSGYGGAVLSSNLWEFDSNRDYRDWNGWIKATGTPAAANGARIEAEAEWLTSRPNNATVIATVHTLSWDGQSDSGDFLVSPDAGTLSVVAESQVPDVLSGNGVPLLLLTLTAHGQAVSLDSLNLQIVGTATPTSALSLRLMDGATVVDPVVPISREVNFSFPAIQVGVGSTSTLSVVGDFTASNGETFGLRPLTAYPFGIGGGVVSMREVPGARAVGYLGSAPLTPQVDGGFGEWTALSGDAANDVAPRANQDIDLGRYGAQHDNVSTFLYTDVAGRILRGTPAPEAPRQAPQQGPSTPDTDRDTVPDGIDPMPLDFNNDGIQDSQSTGDYDGDGIVDYGFLGGTDYWLNTTLPGTFPAPYSGRSVSIYVGPSNRPSLLGEDALRIFLDIDNSTWSGYSIGGIGADRLVEIRGKDGQVTQSALLVFSGSFPGQWSWDPLSPVTIALGYHAVELAVPLNATQLYVETSDFWGSVDSTSAVSPLTVQVSSFKVSAADRPLSVPWLQAGPQASATPIDGSSNSVTTVYNQQRKVVRAGDVAGQTACDATNSDGCWYVVFSDQLVEDAATTVASTETITKGSKVSGTFPTDIQSENAVYIQYREANTGGSISFVGAGAQSAVASGSCAASLPSGWTEDDFGYLIIVGRPTDTTMPSAPTGWSQRSTYLQSVGANDLRIITYWRILQNGDSNPSVTLPSQWAGFGAGMACQVAAYRSVDSATPFDVSDATNGAAAAQTWTPPAVTTSTANAWVISAVSTADDNALDCTSPGNCQSFNLRMSGVNYDTTQGGDMSAGLADLTLASPGTPTMITWRESANGNDAWAGITAALKPANYQLEVRYDWTGVPGGSAYTLNVKGYRQDEDILVQVLTPPSTWNTRTTISATSNTLYTCTLTSSEYNSGSPSVRFVDANAAEGTASDFWVDTAVVVTKNYWDRIILMRSSDTSGSTWGSQVILASGRSADSPLLYPYDSSEPTIAIDSGGFLHIAWVSASTVGDQSTLDRVRYARTMVAYPTQTQLGLAANWEFGETTSYYPGTETITTGSACGGTFPTDVQSSNNIYRCYREANTAPADVNSAPGTETITTGTEVSGTFPTDASSSDNVYITYREANTNDGTVSFVNAGAQVTGTGASLTPALPSGWQQDDVFVAIVASRQNAQASWTFPGGWTQRGIVYRNIDTSADLTLALWWKIAGSSESNPSVTINSGTNGWSAQIAAYHGVDTASVWDIASSATGTNGAAATWTPPSVTTVTANAWALSTVATSDTNALGFSVSQSFTARMSGASYDTSTGSNHAIGLADKLIASPGAVTMPTWSQTVNGPDSWTGVSDALRPRITNYKLNVQYDWSGISLGGDAYSLRVEAHHTAGEDFSVQVWDFVALAWNTRITITKTSDDNSVQTYTLTTNEFNSGSPRCRFISNSETSDPSQNDFIVDMAVVTKHINPNYQLEIRHDWSSTPTDGNSYEVCVEAFIANAGGESMLVQVLTPPSTWNTRITVTKTADDNADQCYTLTTSEFNSGAPSIRWTGGTETGDATQSDINIDHERIIRHSVKIVDDANPGFMPTVSTDTNNNPHIAWSGSKTSGSVYYKNKAAGAWRATVSWGTTYTGISVDVSPQNNYVSLARYYEAATNEIQYTVCKNLATSNCDASSEFTKWDGTAGYDTVATSVEGSAYPSLATTYEANGDLWIAYAKDVDGATRAIYARFLDYPSNGFAAVETVDSLGGTQFTRPTIGLDKDGHVHALYVAISGPQLYYKSGTAGSWGSRIAVDTSTDHPSLMVRAPSDATYGVNPGAVYWKYSTSETYFYYIPEFESVIVPIVGAILVSLLLGKRARKSRTT